MNESPTEQIQRLNQADWDRLETEFEERGKEIVRLLTLVAELEQENETLRIERDDNFRDFNEARDEVERLREELETFKSSHTATVAALEKEEDENELREKIESEWGTAEDYAP